MENIEVGDFVLCTVDRIVGTVVFVKIMLGNREVEGNIVMSEIASGRIRNIRDYVVPKKKIVCKVLRISPTENIDLSLRRVSQKERKEVIEQHEQEKSYASILKGILGEKAEEIIREITKKESLVSFLENAKSSSDSLEKMAGKENAKKIVDILNTQKNKKKKIKKEIRMTTTRPDGIIWIRKILSLFRGIDVRYISAGRYSLETEAEDAKTADKKIRDMIIIAEKDSKKAGIEFSVK